jgi:hypothetical protein
MFEGFVLMLDVSRKCELCAAINVELMAAVAWLLC